MKHRDARIIESLERKLADAARERTVFRAILDQSPMAIALRDMESRFVWVNRRFETLLNVRREDSVGRLTEEVMAAPLGEYFAADEDEDEDEAWGSGIANARSHTLDIDGETRHFISLKFPVREEDGTPFGTATIALDVTALRTTEEELERTRALMDSLLANFPFPVVARGLDGRILLVNAAWEDFEGRSQSEVLGRSSEEVLPSGRAKHYEAQSARAIEAQAIIRGELQLDFGPDERTIEFSKFPLYDAGGEIFGVGGTAHDVTDQRRMEDKLRHAIKMEAVGQLTGGVAHDFNNILGVILGRVELLERKVGDSDHHVAEISKAARRGSELVGQLLSFSRRQPLQPAFVELPALVHNMAQLLRRTVGEATRLRTRFAPDCAAASADPAQIESVILNLVINARDAMPQGGEIEVFGENAVVSAGTFEDARELSGNFVTLSVRDEGAGMSPDLIARAFDPFFTTKPVGQGSGLGLSMVYGFAKQSGGHATIRSTPGIGTTVTVYLKQAEVTAQANSVEKVAEHLDITDTVNVLVLEDDDHVATLLGEMLSLLGHQAAIASDPDAARAMLAAGDGYQVIVSDIRLNLAVTGPEFVHEMQGLYPGLKAIFTSDSPPEGVRQSSGLDQYASLLQKPFTEDDLLLALNQVMNR